MKNGAFQLVREKEPPLLLALAVLTGLYVCSIYNYLLFHTLAELLCVAVSWGIFFIVWNTRSRTENGSIVLIGIAYFFVGIIDIFHTLAYKGMGVFPGHNGDLPTQLWIAARYVQAISLAIAPWVPDLKRRWGHVFAGYLITTTVLVGTIFWGSFPWCFTEGAGLTTFKKGSEYFVCLLILIAAAGFRRKQHHFHKSLITWLMVSFAMTVFSELLFAAYVEVYGLYNVIGHYFKILATWCMYRALIEYGLNQPLDVLFREHKQCAESLTESEARLRDLYVHAPVAYFSVSAENGLILRCNKTAGKLLGYDEHELIGRHVSILYSDGPSGKPKSQGIFSRLQAGETIADEEMEMERADGSTLWVSLSIEPSKDLQGRVTESRSIALNITERKQAEEALRRSEQRYRDLWEKTPVMMISLDAEARINFASDRICEELGYDREDLLGKTPFVFQTKESAQYAESVVFPQFLKTGVVTDAPLQLLRRNGEVMDVLLSVTAERDAGGKVVRSRSVFIDVTERKRAEARLQESEQRYGAFLNSTKDLAFLKDEESRYVMVNRANQEFFGKPESEIIGKTDFELMPPHAAQECRASDLEALDSEGVVVSEEWWEDRVFETKKFVVKLPNGRNGVGGLIREVTDWKKAEAALTESEQRFGAISRSAFDGIILVDDSGGICFWNTAAERIFGYTADEVMGKDVHALLAPAEYHGPAHAAFRNFKLSGTGNALGCTLEFEAFGKSDEKFPIELSLSNFQLGGRWHAAGIVRDITERKKAEEALARSELLYRTLFEGARDAIMLIDMEGDDIGRIVSANPVAAAIHGYSLDEFMALKLDDLETFDSAKGLPDRVRVALSGQLVRGEVNHRRKDGSIFPLEISASPFDIRGHKYCIAIDRDITERKIVEETLAAERSKFKSILDHMVDAVYIVNPQFEVEYANPALISERGDVAGRKCHEYLVGRAEPCPWCRNREVLAGESILWERTSEVTGLTYDIFETPMKNQDGSVSILLILHDITARKKSEKLLRLSEQRYRALVSSAGNGIIVQDSTGTIITWNKEAERIFGIDEEDILGKVFTEQDWKTFREDGSVLSASEHPSLRTLATGEPIRDQLMKIVRHTGDFSWVNVNTAAIFEEANAKPIAVVIALTDFTERKEIERALRENEQFLRQTERIARVGGWRTNPLTDELHWTQGVHDIVEAPLDYKPGLQEALKFCKPQYIASLRKMLTDTLESGLSHAMEVEVTTTTGKHLWTEVRSLMRVDESSGPLVLGTFQDITERKTLERQLLQAQKMEAIGTLAGGIAHDFNNVLQVALGYSELLLEDEDLPQRYRTDLKKINNSARLGADLIERLLMFSRKSEIKLRPLNLNRRITELRKMLGRTIPKMIDIDLNLGQNLATINADPTQIDQILMNLAVNARDAMPDGGKLTLQTANIRIDDEYARTHVGLSPGAHVVLTLTDTGSGMNEETLQHIFEPFYTTKGVGEGTGLGLAVVHGIVKQHGAHIECLSLPGRGTTFKIYFPALISAENEQQKIAEAMPPGGSDTILLVDDEEFVRDLGGRILTMAGYTVITASNGKEALEIFRRRKDEIAVVLLDLMMPEMGGKECLEGLLGINPSAKVVIASGYAISGPAREALEVGAKAFVNKPYDMRRLREVVRKVLDGA